MSVARLVLLALFLLLHLSTLSANQLISTESDPDVFIQDSVNVINGNYCEAATDLLITGPGPLVLQRFYTNESGWKIFPERFLVVGKDPSNKSYPKFRSLARENLKLMHIRYYILISQDDFAGPENLRRQP